VSLASTVQTTVPADGDNDNAATFTVGMQKSDDYLEAMRVLLAGATLTYHVGPTDMVPMTGGSAQYTLVAGGRNLAIQTGTAGTTVSIDGKVRLPAGATITGLQLLLGQTSTGAVNATAIYLGVEAYNAGGLYTETLAVNNATQSIAASGSAGIWAFAWTTITVTQQTLSSDGYVHLQMNLPGPAAQFSGLAGARVTFTTTGLKSALS